MRQPKKQKKSRNKAKRELVTVVEEAKVVVDEAKSIVADAKSIEAGHFQLHLLKAEIHALNNTMTAILGYLQLAEMELGTSNEHFTKALAHAKLAIGQMTALSKFIVGLER